ncbi:MAG: AAA family ATPase [Candidatus Enteromonas sp.]|nr:AAA family ATPase [Candidatus Enteromonas sp.]
MAEYHITIRSSSKGEEETVSLLSEILGIDSIEAQMLLSYIPTSVYVGEDPEEARDVLEELISAGFDASCENLPPVSEPTSSPEVGGLSDDPEGSHRNPIDFHGGKIDIRLTGYSQGKEQALDSLQTALSISEDAAKDYLDGMPVVVATHLDRETASKVYQDLVKGGIVLEVLGGAIPEMMTSTHLLIQGTGPDDTASYEAIASIKKISLIEAMELFSHTPFELEVETLDEFELIVASKTAYAFADSSSEPKSEEQGGEPRISITSIGPDDVASYLALAEVLGIDMVEAMGMLSRYPFDILKGETDDVLKKAAETLKKAGITFDLVLSEGSAFVSPSTPKTSQTAEERLRELVGLSTVKRQVEMIKAYVKKNEGMKKSLNLNMAFLGNPGTGKTIVARLMGEILHSIGALPSSRVVECSAKDLIAGYVGQTAKLTDEKIEEAMGGVLYIDETYAINPKENPYGKECVDTLLKAMEDRRGEIAFIFAGYPAQMQEFLEWNPGLESRVKFLIPFEDYNKEELKKILQMQLRSDDYEITPEALDALTSLVDSKRYSPRFGNGREARTALEKVELIQALRTSEEKEDRLIGIEDIAEYAKENGLMMLESDAPEGEAFQALHSLIGLDEVKENVSDLISYFAQNRGKTQKVDFHMAFLGNPGTGKTIVAQLLGKILFQEGILPSSRFLEVSAPDLIAGYVGQTAIKTREAIQKALGGVLFIDEAYALATSGNATFGEEAIAELLKAMEDHRGEFAVFFAGYPKEMNQFLVRNPGLQSRVKFTMNFADYTYSELLQIGEGILKKDEYEMADAILQSLTRYVFSRKKERGYANARTLREAISSVEIKHAGRVAHGEEADRQITMADLYAAFGKENIPSEFDSSDASPAPRMIPLTRFYEDQEKIPPHSVASSLEEISEAVVAISTEGEEGGGESSGFLVSEDGYVVTCAHCVRGASTIRVRLRIVHRGRTVDTHYEGKAVAVDEENDVAILHIEGQGPFPYLRLERQGALDLPPLSEVYLLGYPFGVSRFDSLSVNQGKIASYQRGHEGRPDQINLDISAKSGNSGSAVLDATSSFVIGILCGSSTSQSGSLVEEINYCRPVSYVYSLIRQKQTD